MTNHQLQRITWHTLSEHTLNVKEKNINLMLIYTLRCSPNINMVGTAQFDYTAPLAS